MRPRHTMLASGVAASLLALAACGGGGSSSGGGALSVTKSPVNIMGFSTSDEVGTSRVKYAEKKLPKLRIKVDQNGFDPQKFATAMAGGTRPAGVYLDRTLVATYAAKGFLMPLDKCASQYHIDLGQYYGAALNDARYKGHLYAIPDFYTTTAVLIDNRVLKRASLTRSDIDTSNWAKLKRVAVKMYASSGGKPTTIGYDPKLPEYLPLWAVANGGSIVDKSGKPTLSSPKVVEALRYTVGLINAQGGWAKFKSYRDTWDFFGAGNPFTKDQIGAMDYEQWYVNVLQPYASKVDFSATFFRGRDGRPLTLETGAGFAIPKGSPNAGGMCRYMKELTSQGAWAAAAAAREAKVEKTHGMYTGVFSANRVANTAAAKKYIKPTGDAQFDQVIKTYYQSLKYAQSVPPSPAYQETQAAYQEAVAEALGGKDAQAALDKAQRRALSAYQDAQQ